MKPTRIFGVGFVRGEDRIRFQAIDESTKHWAGHAGPLMSVVLWEVEQELGAMKLIPERELWERAPSSDQCTPSMAATAFRDALSRAWPEERFSIGVMRALYPAQVLP